MLFFGNFIGNEVNGREYHHMEAQMKKFSKFMIFVILLATVAIVTTAMANDNHMTQVAGANHDSGEVQLLEWDGMTLNSRSVQVSSAAERELIDEWNGMYREQAELLQQTQNNQLPETPQREVIETAHGTVTVENRATEDEPAESTQEEINVEIEQVETSYGVITIEKHSFGEPIDAEFVLDENDSDIQPTALSEYTDPLYKTCSSNGVEFNFGSNNTQSNYELHWNGGSYSDYVVCSASSCTFKITTSWSAYYTYGKAYTTSPGYVYGFGFDDYRCR